MQALNSGFSLLVIPKGDKAETTAATSLTIHNYTS